MKNLGIKFVHNNSDKTSLLEYINGIINLLKESIEKQLDTNNADIKELHKTVSALLVQVEKNKDQLSLINITVDKHQNDYKELLKEVNRISLEMRDIRTRTNTLVWIGKVISKIPIKWVSVFGVLTMVVMHFWSYFHEILKNFLQLF